MKKSIIIAVAFCALVIALMGFLLVPDEPVGLSSRNLLANAGARGELTKAKAISAKPPAAADIRDFSDIGLKSYSLVEAQEVSKNADKYLLMYFWASWCGNCSFFEQSVLPSPEIVRALNDSFAFVSIDFDRSKELARALRLRSVPTFIFLDPAGEAATVLPGAVPPDIFLMVLNYVSTGSYKTMDFEDYAETLT
ncbi:MAG: thioredoxin fold domain-containing protein [Deltaproteobacteria bacterium]|jgi:thioredoxin-related protein|nr:thioredoxin fold domain-containing protein [Deltaproteobacteria bacterium]